MKSSIARFNTVGTLSNETYGILTKRLNADVAGHIFAYLRSMYLHECQQTINLNLYPYPVASWALPVTVVNLSPMHYPCTTVPRSLVLWWCVAILNMKPNFGWKFMRLYLDWEDDSFYVAFYDIHMNMRRYRTLTYEMHVALLKQFVAFTRT